MIELVVAVSVMLALAAIASTYVLRARMLANEAAALSAVRTILTAEQLYLLTYSSGFSNTLAELGPPASGPPTKSAADLIPAELASGTKGGYTFSYKAVVVSPGMPAQGQSSPPRRFPPVVYTLTAAPVRAGISGNYHFYVDESNVIRLQWGRAATLASRPVGR